MLLIFAIEFLPLCLLDIFHMKKSSNVITLIKGTEQTPLKTYLIHQKIHEIIFRT